MHFGKYIFLAAFFLFARPGYSQPDQWNWVVKCPCSSNCSFHDLKASTLGNIYGTGYFGADSIRFGAGYTFRRTGMFLAKWDTDGNLQWAIHGGEGTGTGNNSLLIGRDESVFIAGTMSSTAKSLEHPVPALSQNYEGFLSRFDPNGKHLWSLVSAGENSTFVQGMAFAPNGSILLVGRFSSGRMEMGGKVFENIGADKTSWNWDGFLLNVFPDGEVFWGQSLSGIGPDVIQAVTADQDGNIYIGGFSNSQKLKYGDFERDKGPAESMFIAKLSPSGKIIWMKSSLHGFGEHNLPFMKLVVDMQGDLWVATAAIGKWIHIGDQQFPHPRYPNYPASWLMRLNPLDGSLLGYEDPVRFPAVIEDMIADPSGGVLISASVYPKPGSGARPQKIGEEDAQPALARFAPEGDWSWIHLLDQDPSRLRPAKICLGSDGSLIYGGAHYRGQVQFGQHTLKEAGTGRALLLGKTPPEWQNYPGK